MGCKTCKQEKTQEKQEKKGINSINLIDDKNLIQSSFLFKLVSFLVIIIALPLLNIVLLYMVFVNLFVPRKNPSDIFNDTIEGIANKWMNFKTKRELRKKEKIFGKNRDYSGESELLDIEVFTNKEDNETEDSE